MLNPINTASSASSQSIHPSGPNSALQPVLAEQLRNVANDKTASPSKNPLTSRPSESFIAAPHAISIDPKRLAQQQKDFKIFSTMYNTNAGCKAINAAMRGSEFSVKVTVPQVMNEIGRRHPPEAIARYKPDKKTGESLKLDMEIFATKDNLQRVAAQIYGRAPSSTPSGKRVHRGQGMTPLGVNKLIALRRSGTAVQATHFLSCDDDLETAKEFAGQYDKHKEEPVLFQIRGFSNVRLRPYMDVLGESETLFTPHATFQIDLVGKGQDTGYTIVRLTEIAPTENAVSMPY
ncbi:MAG: arginine ADP-ribosyltransferase family protein [Herbaspirillum sp.]|jgi:hypothetical protein|nr:arginine ADP-ribosyltransferase family protein [Herbaspirillum sp.]